MYNMAAMRNLNETQNTPCYKTIFFSYSIAFMELLLCQPFHDWIRFILYLTVLVLGFITILKTWNLQPHVFNIAAYLLLSTEIWTSILLFVHGEFMIYGLAALINISFFIIGLQQTSSDDLLKEALTVTRVLTYTTLFIVIISLSIKPIMAQFPALNDLRILGKPFVFSDISAYDEYRLKGFAHHPNQTGMICSTAIISSFFVFLFSSKKTDIIVSIINIVLNSLFLILASSRSPIVATATFLVAFLIYYFSCNGITMNATNKRLLTFIIVCFICLAIVLTLAISNDNIKDYLLYKIIRVQNIETATGRTELQKITINDYLAKHKFFLGLSKTDILNTTGRFGPHNTFIEILTAKGIISFILFIGALLSIIVYSIRLLLSRDLSSSEKILMPLAFGMIFATIVQNSFESAYLYELTGAAPFERWALCIPAIVWCNHRKKKSI